MKYASPLLILISSICLSVGAEPIKVVFDVDLTRGDAGPGHVTGGVWDAGWRCTGAKDERIVFDAGPNIINGMLEVSFTAEASPWQVQQGKINFAGLHESETLSQNTSTGDVFYARTGNPQYRFANVKAAGRAFDRTEYEPRVGSTNDWICDGHTVMTIRFEWRDGVLIFHDPASRVTVFPRDIIGADTPVDRLRYAFIGSDRYTGLTVKGLRFTRAKLMDLGPDAEGPSPERLRVSENGRSLQDDQRRTVFLLADTAWSLAVRTSRSDAEAYLRQRRAQRFNAVTFVLFPTGNPDLAGGLANHYGHAPFRSVEGRPDPTQPDVRPGPDNDYWDQVDWLVALTKRLGLYAIVLPTWGSGVTGSYNGKEREKAVFDAANARAYGRWLGRRYQDQPHLLWMLGGDVAGAYTNGHDFTPVFRAMAQGLEEGSSSAQRPLMSFHPQKPNPRSAAWFHDDPWLSFNSIQAWPEVQPDCIAADWKAAPPKPTWIFEGRYEGYWKKPYQAEQWGEWQIRQQAYQTVFAGAFGHTYGHERVFGFGKDGADWKQFLDTPGARSMTHLAKFMNSLKHSTFSRFVPDSSLISGEPGRAERLNSDRVFATRHSDGHIAMFYSASGRIIRVRMDQLGRGPMHGFWFNPRNGFWHVAGKEGARMQPFANDIPSGPGAGEREFDPPGGSDKGRDWVLVLGKNPALY